MINMLSLKRLSSNVSLYSNYFRKVNAIFINEKTIANKELS